MKKRYLYKNIIIKNEYGRYNAYYNNNGKIFMLHCLSCGTRKEAYRYATAEIDYLNTQEV